MWQRIQTLWWLISIVAMSIFIGQDIILLTSEGSPVADLSLSPLGVHTLLGEEKVIYSNWVGAIIAGVSIALSAVSIFIYKMRTFQLRLSILNALVLVGLILSIAYITYLIQVRSGAVFSGITVWLCLPLVAIIAQTMAARSVLNDEVLIRMSERLR